MIVLGLGSNHPDALNFLRRALAAIKASGLLKIQRVSPLYKSEAMVPDGAPTDWNQPFLNLAVAVVSTESDPFQILRFVKDLEVRLGRHQRERWAPREIDIDILLWPGKVLESETLCLPHVGLSQRPFALLPLADIYSLATEYPQWHQLAIQWQRQLPSERPFCTERSELTLARQMVVLNLTPDSFSDGGRWNNDDVLRSQLQEWQNRGVDLVDLGAESTRPGAKPVAEDEELSRLQRGLEILAEFPKLQVSLDCRQPTVLSRLVQKYRIDYLNDVNGFNNPQLCEVAGDTNAQLILMHSLDVPPRRDHTLPTFADPIDLLKEWSHQRIAALEAKGLARSRLILDPGIGFGKTTAHNWEILRRAQELHATGLPLLVGHSRKSFLQSVSEHQAADRDLETAWISTQLAAQGIEFLRIHDPITHNRMLRLWNTWNGISNIQM